MENKIEKKANGNEYVDFRHSAIFFKNIFKTLGSVNNEAKICFSSDKIKTAIIDPANVLMITLEIPNCATTEYKVTKKVELGFDLDKLNYILKNNNKDDTFTFVYDSDVDLHKSSIIIGLFNHTYTLINKKQLSCPKIPNLDLPVQVKLNTKILYDFLVQADRITDYVEVIATRNNLTFNAMGDTDKVTVTLNRYQLVLYDCHDTYKSKFSVNYLLGIVKHLKTLFGEIELNIGNDNPLRIIGNDIINVVVLLAPRIENED